MYVVQMRFHSEFSVQENWVSISYHRLKNEAECQLKWQQTYRGYPCIEYRIIAE